LAGWASYGYCTSHSRYFWGLRLHLVCTVHGLPITFALTSANTDEREVLISMFDVDPGLLTARPGQVLIVDKGYRDAQTKAVLAARGVRLLRPACANEPPRPGAGLLKSVRQLIESVNDTLKGQLDLERHGGRTIEGVAIRVLQRLLALTAAIWHNHSTGQPVLRSLIAYDH
jgi:Transposase DDE domain